MPFKLDKTRKPLFPMWEQRNIFEKKYRIFRSRKIFSSTYAIVSFFLFFSPDHFMKIANFSKTVHTIFIKYCSHSTPKGAPACSKASKSYDWNVRNIAKISPKIALFRLFSIFSKTVHTIQTKVSTVILHHTRVLYVQWHQNRIGGTRET